MQSIKIFLSSTYEDLAEYREHLMAVLDGCEAVYKGMEFFGASQAKPLETCLRNLAASNLVVTLIGTRYGSIPEGETKSFTELELEYALRTGKPVWAYFLDEERTPVLRKHIDEGEAAVKLQCLKQSLTTHLTPDRFKSPDDLGMKLARDLFRKYGEFAAARPHEDRLPSRYRECAYDGLADWYDRWYEGHWSSDKPFTTMCSIASTYFDAGRGQLRGKKILDVACGTGNTFVAFSRGGFETWGTDGSMEMLLRAKDNSDSAGIDTSRLVLTPINWNDRERFLEHFAPASFDIIVNTANSFCHIPPVDDYMQAALSNFFEMLKPGGLLFIDTKRYLRSGAVVSASLFKELQYIADTKEWVERIEREEARELPGFGVVRFNTRIL